MKVLLTGATGFLGKFVLKLILSDERVTRVDVVSRTKRTHPNPKVRMLSLDLSDPSVIAHLPDDTEAVIHLAGLYDFNQGLAANYQQNVLPCLNLIEKAREWNRSRAVPIFFASTYGVGFGTPTGLAEKPQTLLPSKAIPYAYTKAIADRALTDSGLPCSLFRLGVLVGDTVDGDIEKLDGPYSTMLFMHKLGQMGAGSFLRYLPIPGKPDGVLPLVPVDAAARVFHEALFRAWPTKPRIYGVYHPASILIRAYVEEVLKELLPGTQPIFMDKLPRAVLSAQKLVTRVPAESYRFSSEPVDLENPGFAKDFPNLAIPAFESYREAFFRGFRAYIGAPQPQPVASLARAAAATGVKDESRA